MGNHNVSTEHDSRQAQAFMRSLLTDVSALERMIEAGRIESGMRRIGAEQEMFLIDRAMRPAPVAMEVLKNANDHRLTTAGRHHHRIRFSGAFGGDHRKAIGGIVRGR